MVRQQVFRALIVDDEVVARQMLSRSLAHAGFQCDTANDGDLALIKLKDRDYDLVVTDLRMPRRNGHSLAIELLEWPQRPIIAVHTAVVEPRLAKDLMARGVDDIIFKPTNYSAFAAKMRGVVERHHARMASQEEGDGGEGQVDEFTSASSTSETASPVLEIGAHPERFIRSCPLSAAALTTYRSTLNPDRETREIVECIQSDPAFAAEILRWGNSTYYNPNGMEISDLTQIVTRIGRRRLGELALSAGIDKTFASQNLSHLNAESIWRQSSAAGIAARALQKLTLGDADDNVSLAAVMHVFGRALLCAQCPNEYGAMLAESGRTGATLTEIERRVFGASQAETMSKLLTSWNIPAKVTSLLNLVDRSFAEIAVSDLELRHKVELVKMAVLVGRYAVRSWEPWDVVDLPSPKVLQRFSFIPLDELIEEVRNELPAVMTTMNGESTEQAKGAALLGYTRAGKKGFDFMKPLLLEMGFNLTYSNLESQSRVIVNAFDVARMPPGYSGLDSRHTLIICHPSRVDAFRSNGDVVTLPISVGRFRAVCRDVAPSGLLA